MHEQVFCKWYPHPSRVLTNYWTNRYKHMVTTNQTVVCIYVQSCSTVYLDIHTHSHSYPYFIWLIQLGVSWQWRWRSRGGSWDSDPQLFKQHSDYCPPKPVWQCKITIFVAILRFRGVCKMIWKFKLTNSKLPKNSQKMVPKDPHSLHFFTTSSGSDRSAVPFICKLKVPTFLQQLFGGLVFYQKAVGLPMVWPLSHGSTLW